MITPLYRSKINRRSALCVAFGAPATGALFLMAATASAQTVLEDDISIKGQLCVGTECGDTETFGNGLTDQIKVKGSGVGIVFEDVGGTSVNNWALKANEVNEDSFFLEDLTSGTKPFKILGGAPDNSLFVNGAGRVGVGTSLPLEDLHIVSPNATVTLRLEETFDTDGVWDINASSGLFAIDNYSLSQTPLAIESGAPDYSMWIKSNGNLGMGTFGPTASLHISRTDSTGKLLIEDTGSAFNTQVEIKKNGTPRFRFDDTRFDVAPPSGTNLPAEWDLGLDNNRDFILRNIETNFNVFKVLKTGDMVLEGALTQNSDKNAKMAIVPIDAGEVLAKVEALPIATWSYKDTADVRHIGPMAQDFRALFGTGASDTGISTLDTSGVALAAIKALSEDNKALVTEVTALADQNKALAAGNAALVADVMAQNELIAQLAARLDALERTAQ